MFRSQKKTYTVSSLGMRLSVSPESMPCLNNLRFLRHEFFLLSQTIYCYFSIKKHISFFFNFVFLLFLHQKKHFFFRKNNFSFYWEKTTVPRKNENCLIRACARLYMASSFPTLGGTTDEKSQSQNHGHILITCMRRSTWENT